MSHSNNPNGSKGLSLIGERDYLNEAKRLSERVIKTIFLLIVPVSVLFSIFLTFFDKKIWRIQRNSVNLPSSIADAS